MTCSIELDLIVSLYEQGSTARAVGEQFGLTDRSVRRLAHERGVRKNN
ncbi:hypothetical protein [Amycolatopsis sp. NPDC059657]